MSRAAKRMRRPEVEAPRRTHDKYPSARLTPASATGTTLVLVSGPPDACNGEHGGLRQYSGPALDMQ